MDRRATSSCMHERHAASCYTLDKTGHGVVPRGRFARGTLPKPVRIPQGLRALGVAQNAPTFARNPCTGRAARLAERTADRYSTARKQAAIVPERRPDPVPDSEARVLADETVLAHEYLQPNSRDKAALESPEANLSGTRSSAQRSQRTALSAAAGGHDCPRRGRDGEQSHPRSPRQELTGDPHDREGRHQGRCSDQGGIRSFGLWRGGRLRPWRRIGRRRRNGEGTGGHVDGLRDHALGLTVLHHPHADLLLAGCRVRVGDRCALGLVDPAQVAIEVPLDGQAGIAGREHGGVGGRQPLGGRGRRNDEVDAGLCGARGRRERQGRSNSEQDDQGGSSGCGKPACGGMRVLSRAGGWGCATGWTQV